jgi:hypothetical protein
MQTQQRKRLGEILVELGVLTPDQVDEVLAALRRRGDRIKFGRMAKEMGLLQEEHILAALAVQMRVLPDIQHLTISKLMQRLRQPV